MIGSRRVQDAQWPESQDAVRFLVLSQPDARGRQDFYALWWVDGRRKAQFFVADLDTEVRRARRERVEVEVVEAIPARRAAA